MKVYVVSQGNEEFHRVDVVEADWNVAMKYAIEELEADPEIKNKRYEREAQVLWECWKPHVNGRVEDGSLIRVTQLDLS